MALTAEEYKELKALVSAPDSGIDDETRTAALATVQEYEDTYVKGWGEAPEPAEVQPAVGQEPDLTLSLNPDFDLLPQALAIQPASTHPGGDKAASTEWSVSGGQNASGTVFAYEPPLAVVRKRLLEDPAFTRALYPHVPPNPEEITSIDNSSEMYQRAADFMWRETAEAAAGAGKTAYRYSKAPWLHGGNSLEAIQSLGMKALGSVKPAAEGINAFVMGVDDTAAFGAMRAAQETANPEVTEPNELLGIESVGGVPTSDARTRNATDIEEHPALHTLGQGLGALAPWGAANRLFNFVAGGGAKVAAKAGGGLAARTLTSAGSGAVAGAGAQAGQEGVDAAASLAQTGEAGTTLEDAGERVLDTAVLSGGLAKAGELVGSGAKAGADWIRHGRRYGGAPGKLEKAGVKFGAMGPKLSPETKALLKRAQEADLQPGDMLAAEIAPAIKEAADVEVKAAIEEVTARKQAYFATPEGQRRMPAQNLVNRSVEILRRKHEPTEGGALKTLDVSGTTPKVKRIFNNEIGTVSTKPSEGAIELTLEEADEFLANSWKRELVPKKSPAKAEPTTGAREVDLEAKADAPEPDEDAIGSLRRQGVQKVYVTPRYHDAKSHEEVLHGIKGFRTPGAGNSSRELQELDQAARMDRDARPLGGKPGGWSALQAENAQLLDAQKKLEKLVSPKGEPFKVLAGHGKPKAGEMLTAEALRKAADKGGVREQLEQIRHMDPLLKLRDTANWGASKLERGLTGKAFDAGAIRAFPLLRGLERPTGPIRGGMGGRGALINDDERPKEEQQR